jgi:hypothetical protein
MKGSRLVPCLLGLAVGLASCTPLPTRFGGYRPGDTAGIQGPSAPRPLDSRFARKVVAEKQESRNVLIAQDGTWCSVSGGRYERVRVGDVVLCTWQT